MSVIFDEDVHFIIEEDSPLGYDHLQRINAGLHAA